MAGHRSGRRNLAIAERFGRNLLKARRDAGLSQDALAALCSLHRTEIGYLENGKRVPRLDTAIRLATALEVPLDDFTEGIDWVRGEKSPGGFLVRPPGTVIPAKSNQGKPRNPEEPASEEPETETPKNRSQGKAGSKNEELLASHPTQKKP